jgi:hypothetical protein
MCAGVGRFFNACSTPAWVSLPHLSFPAQAPPQAIANLDRCDVVIFELGFFADPSAQQRLQHVCHRHHRLALIEARHPSPSPAAAVLPFGASGTRALPDLPWVDRVDQLPGGLNPSTARRSVEAGTPRSVHS